MKKLIFIVVLGMPLLSQAGILGFLGDVSSISSAMNSGQKSYSSSDMKKINLYLWQRVEKKQKTEGYQFLAEALEQSNRAGYLDTAAQTYYINGDTEKAIELYETRVLPTSRATCSDCDTFYKKIVGLSSSQKIPYSEIYEKQKQKLKSLQNKEEPVSAKQSENFPINIAVWGILVVLLLNLVVNTASFFKSKQLTS